MKVTIRNWHRASEVEFALKKAGYENNVEIESDDPFLIAKDIFDNAGLNVMVFWEEDGNGVSVACDEKLFQARYDSVSVDLSKRVPDNLRKGRV